MKRQLVFWLKQSQNVVWVKWERIGVNENRELMVKVGIAVLMTQANRRINKEPFKVNWIFYHFAIVLKNICSVYTKNFFKTFCWRFEARFFIKCDLFLDQFW